MENPGIQSVDRAMELLLYLTRAGQPMGISQIAAEMGLHKSTVYRTLATLEYRGFVTQDHVTDKYFLGSRLCAMGHVASCHLDLPKQVATIAHKLSLAYQEPVGLAIPEVDPLLPPRSMVIFRNLPARMPQSPGCGFGINGEIWSSAEGKCLLAFGGPNLLAQTSESLPSTEVHQLRSELHLIRQQGYAMQQMESPHGSITIAAPLYQADTDAVGAVFLTGTLHRTPELCQNALLEGVLRAAREMTCSLRKSATPTE